MLQIIVLVLEMYIAGVCHHIHLLDFPAIKIELDILFTAIMLDLARGGGRIPPPTHP